MKKLLIVLILILTVLGVGYLAFYSNKYAPNGQSANVAEGLKNYDFTGKGTNGAVSLKSFEGKNKIIYFGYTSCPDVCPATLGILSGVLNELKRDDIVVIFVTLDPERDEPKNVDEYAKYFYPNSYGIVLDNLPNVAKSYGVKYQKVLLEKSVMEYSVAHSSSLYVLDKNDKFVAEISNLTAQNIKKTLENLK
ncbi:cytochrome oxidase biogenesis protein, Sco1/SenC/PrrC family [Campylobacter showae]|uniref:SCO1/SenC n=1 Tax=Campylobacter showae RM3277 TaxID=553219 RepID=C6REQ8_9BACT|nr:SCO family protein [Campylobacter showae]EET80152.1 SCO1/SenC [Campylobacter showae RM3277]QCD48439.1 cytochrome oxidase biogenesis protein, Sco1/SenC/PrrC family [Campylobacter showae]